MKKVILLTTAMLLMITPVSVLGQIMEISADDGDLYEIISADTLADGTQANIYVLTSKDKTYKMSGTITAKGDLTIMGLSLIHI